MAGDWRPGASLEVLRQRATVLQQLRRFFADRDVLEVETPALASTTSCEPGLQSFKLSAAIAPRYLQTSPEFAMKRLLAAGSGAIFQICRCFRRDETGSRHNPEFTMLEWYRPGYDLSDLMLEVAALVEEVLQIGDFRHLSYRQLFEHYLGLNPHQADEAELAAIARARLDIQAGHMSRADWLDVLMSHLIEPQLSDAVFVYDFPMQQASLSRIARNTEGDEVARRFELYIGGMEIANGYDELLDAAQLQQRFETDNVQRQLLGLPAVPVDQRLLAAHRHGLPACAGVALGVDRLLMLKCGVATIDQVLAFSDDRI